MIGPVSGTGRAMMASLQQAMSKGMPPDQAIQYVKSMATQGVAPMTDLYAMVNQFERLKQQQVKPPQTPPTIKDQLNILDQQQQMQPQQGNIQQMQAPAPQAQPMDRGLGAIDAGRMEYPQFAGGGVVALAAGGDPDDYEQIYGRLKGSKSVLGMFPSVSAENLEFLRDPNKFSTEEVARLFAIALSKEDMNTANPLYSILRQRGISDAELKNIQRQTRAGVRGVQGAMADEAEAAKFQTLRTGQTTAPPVTTAPSAGTQAPPPDVAPPIAAAPNPFAGLGSVSGDFSKSRDFLSQLSASKKSDADLTEEQQIEKLEALNKKYGIGKADEEYGKYLERREGEAGKQLAEDRRMALAQAGFAMAEAASRRGRERTGFLGAAAIGGTKAAQLIDKAVRENRALKDRLAESRMALAQSQEMRKAGNIKEGLALQRSAKKDYDATLAAIAQNEQNISELMTRERGMDRRTMAQIGAQERSTAAQITSQREDREAARAAETDYRNALIGLKREELGIKKMAEIAMIPDKEQREKALQEVLKSLAGGEEAMTGVEDLLAKYGR
jgi:hypothetical protein